MCYICSTENTLIDHEPHLPLLLELIFGPAAPASLQLASPRLLRWCRAFQAWLDRRSQTRRSYRVSLRPWEYLLKLHPKPPWELTPADIDLYLAWLKERGLAPGTLSNHISVLNSFFQCCSIHPFDPLWEKSFNPLLNVKRPLVKHYTKTELLSPSQAQAFLSLLQQDGSLLGQRDYAFFLARLRLGVPTGFIQHLQWGQIQHRAGAVWVDWGVGRAATCLPSEVWQAILRYLQASGRLTGSPPGGLPAEAYIFAPLRDALRREASGLAEEWDERRCLTRETLLPFLKTYGQLAGIAEGSLTLAVLRNTAVAQGLPACAGPAEVTAFLGSPHRITVRNYSRAIQKTVAESSPQAPAPQALAPQAPALQALAPLPERKPHRFEPGHGMTHGYSAASQPSAQVAAVIAENLHGLGAEIDGLILLMDQLMRLQARTLDDAPAALLIQAYFDASSRLKKLIEADETFQRPDEGDNRVIEIIRIWCENQNRPMPEDIYAFCGIDLSANFAGTPDGRLMAQVIASDRLLLRRLKDMALDAQQPQRLAYLVDLYGRGCLKLSLLLKSAVVQPGLLAEAWEEALHQAILEWHEQAPLRRVT